MITLRTFLIIVIMFFCTITASAQKPLTKPEKPTQTAPAPKSSSSTTSSGKSSVKSLTQSSKNSVTGYINGHEYVDLGLSVKWATCNIGATSPSDYGNYYAWGETRPKSEYTEENSVTYGEDIGSIVGNSTYDVARANWGGTWRLPTDNEIDELVDKCKWQWTTQGGHNGYKITGQNGNSIFFPAAGWRDGTSLYDAGEFGDYWSATPYEVSTIIAGSLHFISSYFYGSWGSRYRGRSVRPVSE